MTGKASVYGSTGYNRIETCEDDSGHDQIKEHCLFCMFQKTAGISKEQDQHDAAHEILVDEHGPMDEKPREQHRQITDAEIAGSLILFNLPLIQIEKECRNSCPPDQRIAKGCDHTELPIRQRRIRK